MADTKGMITAANVDLSNCDREQIQFAAATLAHGFLVVLREPDLVVEQASRNLADFEGDLFENYLNKPISGWLDEASIRKISDCAAKIGGDGPPVHVGRLPLNGKVFDVFAHRYSGNLIVEFEERTGPLPNAPMDIFSIIHSDLGRLQQTSSMQAFLDLATVQIRNLTGFDRVMAYEFLEDGSGAVKAEAVAPEYESFLNLHYPASDIPAPARRLFKLTWLRHQPDIGYQPSPILPVTNPRTGAPLDLSCALLRSVSIMYSLYLKNMGTQASMVITLMKNGELWGLIACHHHSGPKHVPFEIRAACETLAHMVSLLLSGKADLESSEYRNRLQSSQAQIVSTLAASNDYVRVLIDRRPSVLDLIECTGAAVVVKGHPVLAGNTPTAEQVQRLVDWLSKQADSVFSTDCLSSFFPEASEYAETASGLLAVRIATGTDDYVLWFRPEVQSTVSWAGDPKKPVDISDDGQRLMPRTSFAIWKELVRLKSQPWKPGEFNAARQLRETLLEITARRAGEVQSLYQSLQRTNVELDAFAYIASHDLKEPLRGIHNYTQFLLEDVGEQLPTEAVEKLQTVVRLTCRMDDLLDSLLHYSRLGREGMNVVLCDSEKLVSEVLDTLSLRIKDDPGIEVRVLHPLPSVLADYGRLSEVFMNLISNAIKYSDKENKLVEIGCSNVDGQPIFFVRDCGIGIATEHRDTIFQIFRRLHPPDSFGGGTGTGLTIVRKILDRHNGRIWVESTLGTGSTFFFTIGIF